MFSKIEDEGKVEQVIWHYQLTREVEKKKLITTDTFGISGENRSPKTEKCSRNSPENRREIQNQRESSL